MELMLLGRPGAERTRLQQMLETAGHRVAACHERDWGCVGLDDRCPIDAGPIDVAVAIVEPGDRFDRQGVTCAHRARIPIVTVGATRDDPVLALAAANITSIGPSLLEAIRSAATDAAGHARAIERALHERCAPDERVGVSVERHGVRLDVLLVTDADPPRAAAFADAARAAARAYDRSARVIDVSITQRT